SRRRERAGGGEDAAFGADQGAERGRGAGGREERVADELAVVFLFRLEGDEVLEGPGSRPAGRVGRGEDIGVVVDRDAASDRRTGEAGDQHRDGRVRAREGAGGRRVGRSEDVAAGVPGGAEQGRDAGDSPQVPWRRGPDLAPGRDAARGISGDEDPASFG